MNNAITLIGHVGQNPEAMEFAKTGNKLAKFSLAVNEYTANKEAKPMWVEIQAWNDASERVLSTITKGREIVVQGRLAMNSYSKEADGKTTEITRPVVRLTSFHLCGKKPSKA